MRTGGLCMSMRGQRGEADSGPRVLGSPSTSRLCMARSQWSRPAMHVLYTFEVLFITKTLTFPK
jgi:hypothetical protein